MKKVDVQPHIGMGRCIVCRYGDIEKEVTLASPGATTKVRSCEKCAKLSGDQIAAILYCRNAA